MLKQKSKIIKLKKQQNRLKFWKNFGEFFLGANLLLNVIPISLARTGTVFGVFGSLFFSGYFVFSLMAFVIHLANTSRMIKKLNHIDQEILQLVKTDAEELEILKEYDKIETIEKQIRQKENEKQEQKRLVKELINKKNAEAKKQRNLIKELTSHKKKEAKQEALKEIELLDDNAFNLNID